MNTFIEFEEDETDSACYVHTRNMDILGMIEYSKIKKQWLFSSSKIGYYTSDDLTLILNKVTAMNEKFKGGRIE